MCQVFHIYTDGSFHQGKSLFAGWGWVAVQNKTFFASGSGITDGPAKSRNIDGEIYGVLKACYWLKANYPLATTEFFVDYIGIIHWAKNEWKCTKEISILFVREIQPYLFKIKWNKVLAHSRDTEDPHVVWNNMADDLANKALLRLGNEIKELDDFH